MTVATAVEIVTLLVLNFKLIVSVIIDCNNSSKKLIIFACKTVLLTFYNLFDTSLAFSLPFAIREPN